MEKLARIYLGICLCCLLGCRTKPVEPAFTLSDTSALEAASSTKFVMDLVARYPNTILMIEGKTATERSIYLGFDEGTHTTRHSALRVDRGGVVYRNLDETLAEDRWGILE